jgi:predicted ArsR family transcriptional regulator
MPSPKKSLPELSETLALRRKISVSEAAGLLDIHHQTFRKHYPHLIERVGPRLERVQLGKVLSLGESKR